MQSSVAFTTVLTYPQIDPIAFSLGPLAVHWYGLAYVAGILIGWWLARGMIASPGLWPGGVSPLTAKQVDDFILWAAVGVVLGGRIGYILFYDLGPILEEPIRAIQVWNGGMSFHGGFIGATIAMIIFARRNGIPTWSLFDLVASVVPIGLFFGRIANFVNGELWGRVTDISWAMVFPTGGPLPRHPSQLYEAALEGLLLLAILQVVARLGGLKRPGLITGLFATLYPLARILVEFFREPDPQLGYLAGGWLTMGMVLSLPMLAAGLCTLALSWRGSVSR
ncbi:prolipoprotein diacylglyceryl transferase [Rhizobium halophytocola]|uniref:Phosphatidylglycerol--prolipoprotein diacylglyceryl transferase n=1 Tax=Rhizobium halophytocola TaxID=735519 RepID=A0ABS4E3U1_9HYPH|nr:prolipoprotein diacylglyceryl transferase [Rhizobium halophytocola]MBP1852620.1 phosphatidylglycerol:prolipoprotein diacylglycerol transferase [Rhizobium halophytocola]